MPQTKELLHDALENERRYVAQELHDGIAQTALQMSLQIGICQKLLEHKRTDMLMTELSQIEARLQVANNQVRELIADMRPPKVGSDAPLHEHLQYLIDIHHERNGPPVIYENTNRTLTFPQSFAVVISRIIQEGLLNIRKHAEAKNVWLRVKESGDSVILILADDGKGFDQFKMGQSPHRSGAGLVNMEARAQIIDADFTVTSGTQGTGTRLTLIIPK
ncbi:MAG: histidine kinase [Anaerolineae bacterium]|nr:histidine kinase [Anaerolineae bacterium]